MFKEITENRFNYHHSRSLITMLKDVQKDLDINIKIKKSFLLTKYQQNCLKPLQTSGSF